MGYVKRMATNYGEWGATKQEGGGACEVLPLKKGEGGTESFGVVFLHISFTF